jgi:AcrR family transcriptional regulator
VEFLTRHGRVLVTIARRETIASERLIAESGLSEREVRSVVGDLVALGFVAQRRDGNRLEYALARGLRGDGAASREELLGPLLSAMVSERVPADGPGRGEMHRRLLAAVERLFDAGEPYRELSVERLIGEAGISRATFYTYFDDKTALLVALAGEVSDAVEAASERWASLTGPFTHEQVLHGIRRVAESYLRHRGIMSALTDTSLASVADAERFNGVSERAVSELQSFLEREQAVGQIDKAVDVAGAAHWLTWMTLRGLQRLAIPADDAELERLIRALTGIVWNLLYARAG